MAEDTSNPQLRQLIVSRQDIRTWIRGDETEENLSSTQLYEDAVSQHHAGTGEWLWSNEVYEAWYSTSRNGGTSLGLVASPGSGKTVLAALIARRIRSQGEKVAIFFCSYDDHRRRSAEFALRSLALQLLDFNTSIPTAIIDLYENDRSHQRSKLHSIGTVARVLESLFSTIPRVHILVDGLDELDEWNTASTWFQHLWYARSTGTTKWLVTTRQDEAIRTSLEANRSSILTVSEHDVRRDVEAFLVAGGLLRDADLQDIQQIEIDGNFRWAALLLSSVHKSEDKSPAAVRHTISQFPTGLENLYLRTLEQRLVQLDRSQRKLASRLIAYIVAAAQPLRLKELAHALQVKKGLSRESVEHLGSHLVIVEHDNTSPDNPVVKFPHKTVYDFFMLTGDIKPSASIRRFFVTESSAHEELGKACLEYINNPRYDRVTDIPSLLDHDDHAFLRYAAAYWHHHLDQVRVGSSMKGHVQSFMESPRFWTCVAIQGCIAPFLYGRYDKVGHDYTYSSGFNRVLRPSDVNWGCPLPYFIATERSKAFMSFIMQWHHVLNTWPDSLQHCYMGLDWEASWPAFRQWLQDSQRSSKSILPDDHPSNVDAREAIQSRITSRPCRVVSQTFDATLLDSEDREATLWRAHSCRFCEQSSARQPSPYDKALLKDILKQSSIHLVNHRTPSDDWRIYDFGMNVTSGDPLHPLDCFAVLLGRTSSDNGADPYFDDLSEHADQEDDNDDNSHDGEVEDDNDGDDDNDAKNEDTDGDDHLEVSSETEEEDEDEASDGPELSVNIDSCLVFHRRASTPVTHFWSSPYMTFPRCAYHTAHQQVIWTAEVGRLSVLNLADGQIHHQAFEEPHLITPDVISVYKEVHFSTDGSLLWYVLFSLRRDSTGWQHHLSIMSLTVNRHLHEKPSLHPLRTNTVSYYSTGVLALPNILTAWSDEHVFLALPPLASVPKIIRVSLSPDSQRFETLRAPIFFPSTTCYRSPALYHVAAGSSDLLSLQLDSEAAINKTASHDSYPHSQYGTHSYPSMRGDEQVQDGGRQITWQIDHIDGWRAWDDKLDTKSKEYEKLVSSTNETLLGTYVDTKKSFRVTIRSSLDFRRQAFLSCS